MSFKKIIYSVIDKKKIKVIPAEKIVEVQNPEDAEILLTVFGKFINLIEDSISSIKLHFDKTKKLTKDKKGEQIDTKSLMFDLIKRGPLECIKKYLLKQSDDWVFEIRHTLDPFSIIFEAVGTITGDNVIVEVDDNHQAHVLSSTPYISESAIEVIYDDCFSEIYEEALAYDQRFSYY